MFNLHNFDYNVFLNQIYQNALLLVTILMLISFGIFLFSWLKEPRRLINGVLFTIFFMIFLFWLAVLIFATKNQALITVAGITFIGLVFLIFFALALSWIFLLWNAYIVWKRESHGLQNMLTLLLGIALVIGWIISLFGLNNGFPDWLAALFSITPLVVIYLGLTLFNYLVNLVLYQFYPKRYRQDYLIVLGAGLIDGQTVTPLLANRINRAIKYRNKQVKKGRKAPILIMSGGQGADEKIPEARAMANYALMQGLDSDDILLEDKSKNTFQNMQFSKKIAESDANRSNLNISFVTNNYHTFRAGLVAKRAGLKANGIGAKTRFYFLPNATLREFAAVMVIHKRRHAVVLGLLLLLAIFLSVMSFFII